MNKQIIYKNASLRFYAKNEYHPTRISADEVLLMVYEGVMRFKEDGVNYEIHSGEYHIQKRNSFQTNVGPCDSPKYFWVHFFGEWAENEEVLPRTGKFNYAQLKSSIKELDRLAHNDYTYVEKAKVFYEILSLLYRSNSKESNASNIAEFIKAEYLNGITLGLMCNKFGLSKNHLINIFRKAYGMTPIEYINDLKIKRAMYLLEVTPDSIESIAYESGFNHYSHFYRLFCRKNGCSPEQWRKQVHNNPSIR